MTKHIQLIGAAQGWGIRDSGCEDGPEAFLQNLRQHDIPWLIPVLKSAISAQREKSYEECRPHVGDMNIRLGREVVRALENNHFPLVIGGDHSIAAGTWSGVVTALKAEQDFGLIWIDAHMDAHTPETRLQGKWGGMFHAAPVMSLLGEGEPEMRSVLSEKIKLKPEHVVLIGPRSYEPGEVENLNKFGVKVYYNEDVKREGFEVIFDRARQQVKAAAGGYGISFDLDSLNPDQAPGVGTWEPDGLDFNEVRVALAGLMCDDNLKAFEIVEYNPHRDVDLKTARLMRDLIEAIKEGSDYGITQGHKTHAEA